MSIYIYTYSTTRYAPSHAGLHEHTAAGIGQGTHYIYVYLSVYNILYIYSTSRYAQATPRCTNTLQQDTVLTIYLSICRSIDLSSIHIYI